MQALKRQNQTIGRTIQNYLEEIQKQKELNIQHENQIQTLLKFNERLLDIIQRELVNNKKERDSLNPISQRSQRESDMAAPTHSLIKVRNFAPKSDRGACSVIQHPSFGRKKLENYGKQIIRSQLNHSSHDDRSDYQKQFNSPVTRHEEQASMIVDDVKEQLAQQINSIQNFKKESAKFYDNKISQIKNLSLKITQFKPIDHLQLINQKLKISASTANLLKKTFNKN